MRRLTQQISKLFVILVMLFGSPPVVRLRDLRRPPAIVMVSHARHPIEGWPHPPFGPAAPRPAKPAPTEDGYLPVKAA